ncbi:MULTISPECIES: tripartite tricarboxylate transporter substrate-binding protein [Achromobacter]|uniref:tripartite tricarboxylate transporter substrate-binding protein n=1 Tax=Achromobacter TaxID=222 RepID=UPI00115313D4|nr:MULTISPECIES: tripartite tricarboxylate transporter substrate-binding protein [Achromobacter]MCU6616624.1 tripartite tricarboxylate transporter substrate-binding protein [Achromobacter mucicolens]TQJ98572.1 tripartite-type tricarboxylate transporter receptor subunit TctC [Achromobacter sp. SLBN-14]UDG77933.1 tripartite tricarboxylate transporter substrate binding protein [Achromobacter sp. 77]
MPPRFQAARRNTLLALALAAIGMATAHADQRVIRIVVPYGTGAVQDTIARAIGDELGKALDASIVIENRAGAGGTVGTAQVARAKPDGNTLVLAAASHNIAGYLYKNLSYDPGKDFTGVAYIGNTGYIILASASLNTRNTAEFIQAVKAKPGAYDYASAGNGSASHLGMASFLTAAGAQMQHIPMKSTGDAVTELLAGRVQAVTAATIGVTAYRNDPRVTFLAYTGKTRSRFAPDLPTVAESGLPGYAFDSWLGLLAPAGISAADRDQINAAVNKVLADPKVQARLASLGVEAEAKSAAQFQELLKADFEAAGKVVAASGARVE